MISDACWRQRFASDPRVVGRTIALDGTPRTIVGVLRPDFHLPTERLSIPDAFVPIHMDVERVGWWGDHNNEAIGRLRAGVTPEQARAELDVLQVLVSEIATKKRRSRSRSRAASHRSPTLSSARRAAASRCSAPSRPSC